MTTFEPTPVVGAWWREAVPPDWYRYGPVLGPVAPPRCDTCRATNVSPLLATVSGGEVCGTCAEEIPSCDRCSRPAQNYGYLYETINDDHYCSDCVNERDLHECDDCNRFTRSREITESGDYVCRFCRESDYHRCHNDWCTVLVRDNEYRDYCEDHDDPEPDDDDDAGGLIQCYSFKPYPEFYGVGPLYMGWELEISTHYRQKDQAARLALDHLGTRGYLKEDCSIDGGGFEIVTHPMSHAYALSEFPWKMLTELQAHADAGENGLHVHVNREAFESPAHVYRWLKFLYRNERFVQKVARRESSEWAAFRYSDRQRAKEVAKGDRYGHRYSAVNVNNSATFEVRVFASTLKRQQLMAALDLVAGSVEYTRALTVGEIVQNDGWSESAFMGWVAERPQYEALRSEMEYACAC